MFETRDKFIELIDKLAFPAGAKVRVSVTGLAVCRLNTKLSRLYFLRSVDNHDLLMTIKGTERISGATQYGPKNFTIKKKSRVLVEIENPIEPPSVKTNGDYPLEKMLNLQNLHGVPVDLTIPTKTSFADISFCSFYTIAFFPSGKFNLIEKGTMGPGSTRDIGYVMGGNISCTTPNSAVTVTSDSIKPSDLGPLPGVVGGKEIVYEIMFNNHCTDDDECKKQVASMGGTDFGFYYDVVDEQLKPEREFIMKLNPVKSKAGKARDLSADVAACNPVIIAPQEPYT